MEPWSMLQYLFFLSYNNFQTEKVQKNTIRINSFYLFLF